MGKEGRRAGGTAISHSVFLMVVTAQISLLLTPSLGVKFDFTDFLISLQE